MKGERTINQMEKLSKPLLPETIAGGFGICCEIHFGDGCMDGKMQLRTFREDKRVSRGRSRLLWSWTGLAGQGVWPQLLVVEVKLKCFCKPV